MPYQSGVIGTFSGMNIVALPCDTQPGVTAPSSIEWDPQEVVATTTSPFSGATQTYDWMASWLEGQVSFPPMSRLGYDAWTAFILSCRGPLNCFQMGDPKAVLPKGAALGSPVVNGANQTGYSLSTRGWTPTNMLNNPDFVQGGVSWAPQTGWSVINAAGPSGETIVGRYLGPGTAAISNSTQIPCTPGMVIKASCKVEGSPTAVGQAVLRINTYSATGTVLTTTNSANGVPNIGWQTLTVSATAPTNAAYVCVDFAVFSATSDDAWLVSEFNASNGTQPMLLPGDYIQIGYRLYRVLQNVYADALGNAAIPLWPNLRDQPADGTSILTRNCKGLFRLSSTNGNKASVNPGAYGLSGFRIREAI